MSIPLAPPQSINHEESLSWESRRWLQELYKTLDQPVYRDILGQISVRGVGASDPAWSIIGATTFSAYKFSVGDEIWISFHLPHDYILGSGIFFHAHWVPDGTNTNSVKWQFTYSYAKGHNQGAFGLASPTTVTAEQVVGGTPYQHYVTETAEITDDTFEPDGIINVHVSRITNGATDNTDGVFLFTTDVHYQSNNLGTINRAPNFYGR